MILCYEQIYVKYNNDNKDTEQKCADNTAIVSLTCIISDNNDIIVEESCIHFDGIFSLVYKCEEYGGSYEAGSILLFDQKKRYIKNNDHCNEKEDSKNEKRKR